MKLIVLLLAVILIILIILIINIRGCELSGNSNTQSEIDDLSATSSETISISSEASTASLDDSIKVGDIVEFGDYQQDPDKTEKESIQWRVFDIDGNNALLVSEYGLDAKPYNSENTDVTWENCTLRAWLNDYFFDNAFTLEERSEIQTTTVANDDNPDNGTPGGNSTQDKVFLLSIGEAEKYSNSSYSVHLKPTKYAVEQGATALQFGEDVCSFWLLRSPGYHSNYAAYVYDEFLIAAEGHEVTREFFAIRPVIWVDLRSINN